jgi:hypothetical protein
MAAARTDAESGWSSSQVCLGTSNSPEWWWWWCDGCDPDDASDDATDDPEDENGASDRSDRDGDCCCLRDHKRY